MVCSTSEASSWNKGLCRKCAYIRDKDKEIARNKIYYEKNKQKMDLYRKSWVSENREKARGYTKKYRASNLEKEKERVNNYHKLNKDNIKERQNRNGWYGGHYRSALRYHKKLNATPSWLTDEQKQQLKDIYYFRPKGYHVDHIVPIQGKNVCGLHVPWNLQYLSAEVNLRKSNK